jgi:hypothetical protein
MLTIKLLIAQITVEKKKLRRKKPLPVPVVAESKPKAMSSELTCSQSSSLITQNIVEIQKFNMENTTAGTGSGCEQALGHEL